MKQEIPIRNTNTNAHLKYKDIYERNVTSASDANSVLVALLQNIHE